MSSAVSLVPTTQKSNKKKRPAFRPGAGPRKKQAKKSVVVQKKKQLEQEKIADDENFSPPATEQPQKEIDEATEPVAEPEKPAEPVSESIPAPPSVGPLLEPSQQDDPPQDDPPQHKTVSFVEETAPPEPQPEKPQAEEAQPEPESRPAKRPTRRKKKITLSSAPRSAGGSRAQTKSKKKDDGSNLPPGQTSLSTYCTRFRATRRSKQGKNAPAPPPPPPPPDEEEDAAPAGPQVKIVDGEIVLQESSMVVPNARKTVQEVEEEFQHVVEEEGHTAIVGASYNSFVARRKPQHWAVEETKLFYHTLRQVGADFVTMEAFFSNRTRKQLKKKFQRENVKNAHLIEMSLDPRNKLPIDLSIFNVDKDSIVVTRRDQDPIVMPDPVAAPDPPPPTEPSMPESPAQEQAPIVEEEPHDDIFSDWPEEAVEEFTMETEMAIEKPAAIPLAPTTSKTKSKRPKFRAGKSKKK